MESPRGAEENTSDSTLLAVGHHSKVRETQRMERAKPVTRTTSVLLIVVNTVLVILGAGVACLTVSTLKWNASENPTDVFHLNEDTFPTYAPPTSATILEFPSSFKLLGTRLILAASIVCAAEGVLGAIYAIFCGMRFRQTSSISKIDAGFLFMFASATLTAALSIAALAQSWNEFYTSPSLIFSNSTIVGEVYQNTGMTPETWALQLSKHVVGDSAQTQLQARFIIAAVARVSMSLILGFQIAGLIMLCVLNERKKSSASAARAMQKGKAVQVDPDTELEDGTVTEKVPDITEIPNTVDGDIKRQKKTHKSYGLGLMFKSPITWTCSPFGNYAYTGPR